MKILEPKILDVYNLDVRKCGFCGQRLDPSQDRTRPREYCDSHCRDLARRQRDRELIRIGREVKSLFTKEADRG